MKKQHYLVQTNLDGKRVRFLEDPVTGSLDITIGDVLAGTSLFLEQADIRMEFPEVKALRDMLNSVIGED